MRLEGKLKEEISIWRFLDDWKGFVPWRSEKHLQVSIATDSSGYKWGALVFDNAKTSFGDIWDSTDHRPIHLKETDALIKALTSLKGKIENHRIDAYVDNKALIDSWNNGGGRDVNLNDLLKRLFEITKLYNLDLKLHFLPSKYNPADGESRKLSIRDSQLSSEKWSILEQRYGPHSVDLMALDSNPMKDRYGNRLRHLHHILHHCLAALICFRKI